MIIDIQYILYIYVCDQPILDLVCASVKRSDFIVTFKFNICMHVKYVGWYVNRGFR
jgi:hypothetical protein